MSPEQHFCLECYEEIQRDCPRYIRMTGKPICDLIEETEESAIEKIARIVEEGVNILMAVKEVLEREDEEWPNEGSMR